MRDERNEGMGDEGWNMSNARYEMIREWCEMEGEM